MLFDFATEYFSKNQNEGFEVVPQNLFSEFKLYLDKSGFSFTNETEDYLDVIENDLSNVNGAKSKIEEIRSLVEVQKETELNSSKSFIEKTIWLELKARSGGQTAKTNASLLKDEQLNAAIDLINNPEQIKNLLKGNE